MLLNDFKLQLDDIFLNSEYSIFLKKNWIYRNKCNVLDFEYKKIKFAFDFEVKKDGKLLIYLVDRNSCINFFVSKKNSKKELIKEFSHDSLKETILENLLIIKDIIDIEFLFDISIIIPTYNREKLILKCIESINYQTLKRDNFEVIFVDDCSTDSTVDVIRKNINKDINFKIIERSVGSGNASSPRNDGFKLSKSRYVFYIDSDDFIDRDCLKNGLDLADKNQSEIVLFKIGTNSENPRGIPKRAFKKGTIDKGTIIKNNLMRANYIFKFFSRSVLLKNNILFDPAITVSEDRLYNVQFLSRAVKASILADKDYIILIKHDEDHLHSRPRDLNAQLNLFLTGFIWIFTSNLDKQHCEELFNAWYIIVLESIISVLKSKKIKETEKLNFFNNACIFVNNHKYTLKEEYFYNHLKEYTNLLINKDYTGIFNLIERGS